MKRDTRSLHSSSHIPRSPRELIYANVALSPAPTGQENGNAWRANSGENRSLAGTGRVCILGFTVRDPEYVGRYVEMGTTMATTIMQEQREKKTENYMETGVLGM